MVASVNPATRSGTPVLWSLKKSSAPRGRETVLEAPAGHHGRWELAVAHFGVRFLSGNDYGLLGFTPGAADAFPIAMPIAAAVALLKSKDSPEIELQRRRNRLAELAERHRKQEEDERNQQLAPPNGNWTRKSGQRRSDTTSGWCCNRGSRRFSRWLSG